MKRIAAVCVLTLPLLAACSAFETNPVPPAPALTGVQAQNAAWQNQIEEVEGRSDPVFVPVRKAEDALAQAEQTPGVEDYDAASLQAARSALNNAQSDWQALAGTRRPPAAKLAAVADEAHRAQRLAEIARYTALRESGLDRLNALNERANQQASDVAAAGGEITGRQVIPDPLGDIDFETGTARMTPASQQVVAKLARLLKANPGYGVAIFGHTDNQAPAQSTLEAFVQANPGLEKQAPERAQQIQAFNLALSAARARAVGQQLVQDGIDAGRIGARGFGDRRPVASNDTAEGRAKNRRVEAVIVPTQRLQGGN